MEFFLAVVIVLAVPFLVIALGRILQITLGVGVVCLLAWVVAHFIHL